MTRSRRDPRLRAVEWHDLIPLRPWEKVAETSLSLPWLAGSLALYGLGWPVPGLVCSFFFFLTGLRQVHGAQHYTLGFSRRGQDALLAALSVLMLASMHAIQATHMHHHRLCLDEEDVESWTARLPGWVAVLAGPWFIARLHIEGWRLGKPAKRRWMAAEIGSIAAVAVGVWLLPFDALRWHVGAMGVGECLTGFFAVWTVHRGCEADGHIARTQRGWMKNFMTYHMFFHLEHHLFPAVPTRRRPVLAERLDRAAPEQRRHLVF